jgi:hypothetical protein
MRTKPILIVGVALFIASCATMSGKPVQSPPVGIGSSQQGPSLNGDADDLQAGGDRTTGVTVDAVRVVDGQLVWGAAR